VWPRPRRTPEILAKFNDGLRSYRIDLTKDIVKDGTVAYEGGSLTYPLTIEDTVNSPLLILKLYRALPRNVQDYIF
jgi:hypothetical protein